MAAQSLASRSRDSRRKSTDADDVVLARALAFTTWARNNARLVVTLGVVLLVAVGAALYYWMYRTDRMERAAAEFMQLEQSVMSGNTEVATRDLERFAQRFDGTLYADEARVVLGRLHLQAGEPQEAIEALDEVASRVGDTPVGAPAALLMATAQAQAGSTEQAIATYLRIADEAEARYQRQEALGSAAALREQAGDFAGAAELYRRLVETADPGSMQRSIFEMRLAEAEARASTQQ